MRRPPPRLSISPTLPWAARLLGVSETGAIREVNIESTPLEDIDATLLQSAPPEQSKLAGEYVSEVRLPSDAVITHIQRDGKIFVPGRYTVLNTRDHFLLATSNQDRTATERRLRAISRAGRLAGWHGERGNPDAAKHHSPSAGKALLLGRCACGGTPCEPPPRPRVAWFPQETGRDKCTDAV